MDSFIDQQRNRNITGASNEYETSNVKLNVVKSGVNFISSYCSLPYYTV